MSDRDNVNPYAPPVDYAVPKAKPDKWEDGKIFRDGNKLIIYDGAALPKRCFVTGEDTNTSVRIKQIWQPDWVTWLLLLGLIPYFLVSPFAHRVIHLRVPVGSEVLAKHRRYFGIGILLIVFAGALFALFTLSSFSTNLILVFAAMFGVAGYMFASREPVRLSVVAFNGPMLVLENVHPRCLLAVPDWATLADSE